MPLFSEAVITAAPAPSPNSMHVVLSLKFTFFDKQSAPTIRIVL